MLARQPDKRGVKIGGPRYERRAAWGHLLNAHYLHDLERQQKRGRKPGPKQRNAAPFVLVNASDYPDAGNFGIVVVHSMDRLAGIWMVCAGLSGHRPARGVRIEFVKEHLSFTGEDSPMASLMLSVMGAFAEFARALIHERRREGIALAKQRGAYKGRRRFLSETDVTKLPAQLTTGKSKAQVAREAGISRETLYQYLKGGTIRGMRRTSRSNGELSVVVKPA